jgi:hypothetical protein
MTHSRFAKPPAAPTLASKVARVARAAAKPPAPLEYDIHVAVVAELRRRPAPGVILPDHRLAAFHCPNEGKRSAKFASGLQLMGVSAGVPDLVIVRARACSRCSALWVPHLIGIFTRCAACLTTDDPTLGASAALELKRRGEKPRETQVAWLEHLAAAGWLTGWASSVDEAVALLEGWGMLAPRSLPGPQ